MSGLALKVDKFGPDFRRWVKELERLGGCVSPVMLMGHTITRDARTGAVVHEFTSADLPYGVLMLPCRNRRESVCLPCALLHNGDSFQIVRSGLAGGKGVPVDVGEHPRAFVTVTAPSFGVVHRAADGGVCRSRRDQPVCPHGRALWCRARHVAADPLVGSPLCVSCYDYAGAVVWNASSGGLWWRFVKETGRELARLGGLRVDSRTIRRVLRISYVKVAEFQRRGAVHFHAVMRVDGPGGPGGPAPAWASAGLLVEAARLAGPRVRITVPQLGGGGRRIGLGVQLDAQEIATAGADGFTDQAAASYLAKYVTKDDGHGLVLPSRLSHAGWIDAAPRRMLTAHARRLMHAAWDLGGHEELSALRLRQWAHQLGFRGNVVTKSRLYSTTYGALRRARSEYRREAAGLVPVEVAETETESHWRFVAKGLAPGLEALGAGVAETTCTRGCVRDGLEDSKPDGEGFR